MNIQNIMAQAQKMKRDVEKKKQEIDAKIFPGKSEWVEVEINGKKEILTVKVVKRGLIEAGEFEVLEDMIIIALNDAMKKVDKEVEDKLGQYAQHLDGLI